MLYFKENKEELIGITIGLSLATVAIFSMRRLLKSKNKIINYYGNKGALPASYPRGVRNNNPGNIRKSDEAWIGKIPHEKNTDPDFEQFYNYTHGVRAMIVLLYGYFKDDRDTIKEIIEVYAPSHENDTDQYIDNVSKWTGWNKRKKIDWNDTNLKKLVFAIIRQENAGFYLTHAHFSTAWQMV